MKTFSLALSVLVCTVLFSTPALAQKSGNPLLEATYWEKKPDLNAVKAEIQACPSASEFNAFSFDPVVTAILNGGVNDVIVFLMEQPGNEVNKITHDGRTYLFWAAYKGNVEIMKYALAKGAKTDLVDSHGYSPVNFAALGGEKNTEVYELLIAKGADPKTERNHDGANALLLGVGSDNDLKLTAYFESKGLALNSTDDKGATAFDYAARAGNLAVMKKLLEKGVKPTANAAVMAAMGTRRTTNGMEVYSYLETAGANLAAVNKDGNNALHYAVRKPGQLELVKHLMAKGAKVSQADKEGNTPFMNAAASNTELATMELLANAIGVKDINLANKAGVTPLALAVQGNSPEVVKFLIGKGAGVDVQDAKGNNLTYYLVNSYKPGQDGSFDAKLQLLKEKGLNITAPQKDGNTVYHLAVAKEQAELLQKLASPGVDINAKNRDGMTALHKAAMISKDDRMMKQLIASGASKDLKTEFNETAFDLARENKYLSKNNVSFEFLK